MTQDIINASKSKPYSAGSADFADFADFSDSGAEARTSVRALSSPTMPVLRVGFCHVLLFCTVTDDRS